MSAAKYALVTGANRGIGSDISRKLVQNGKPVIMTARDPVAGAAAAAELNALSAAPALCLPLDTSQPGSIQALAGTIAAQYNQQIDLVVNNAGVLFGGGRWDAETWSTTMATNLKGPLDVTLSLAPHLAPGALVIMVSSSLGSLANISQDYAAAIKSATSLQQLRSIADDFRPQSAMGTAAPGQGGYAPTYSVSKCLLNRAVQLMAAGLPELQGRGVQVVSTCPGWCRTRMGSEAAPRTSDQGADSVLWPYLHWSQDLAGSFTRDGQLHEW